MKRRQLTPGGVAMTWSSPSRLRRCEKSYVAEIFETRLNNQVARRGYLNFLEEKSIGWTKRYVVVRRPYALVYANERDQVERGVINLTMAQIVYNEEQIEMLKVKFYQVFQLYNSLWQLTDCSTIELKKKLSKIFWVI